MSEESQLRADWSARHVRLKYQMVLAAIFVFLTASFEITQINAFGIIRFDARIEPKQIFWVSLLFYLFTVTAFISRSAFESIAPNKEIGVHLKSFRLVFDELKVTTKVLNELSLNYRFNLMEDELQQLAKNPHRSSVFQTSLSRTGYLDIVAKIKKHVENSRMYFQEEYKSQLPFVSPEDTVRTEQFLEIDNSLNAMSKHLQDYLSDAESEFDDVRDRSARALFESNFRVVQEQINNLFDWSKRRLSELKSKRLFEYLELSFLSVIVPLFSSIILVVFGVYEAGDQSVWDLTS